MDEKWTVTRDAKTGDPKPLRYLLESENTYEITHETGPYWIAHTLSPDNALQIERDHNSHAALVEALEIAQGKLMADDCPNEALMSKIQAALSSAKERT
jgi:hypothetical protein